VARARRPPPRLGGGGVGGLTAHALADDGELAHAALLRAASRLGGWVRGLEGGPGAGSAGPARGLDGASRRRRACAHLFREINEHV